MKISAEPTELAGVFVLRPQSFEDERGCLTEIYRLDEWKRARDEAIASGYPGAEHLPTAFQQINRSRSAAGVVRGLHLQWQPPMGKAMRVSRGRALLVAVDVRPEAPTFGQWVALDCHADEPAHVWAPACFARGFEARTDDCEIEYLCTEVYEPRFQAAIRHDDADIGVPWSVESPKLSARDRDAESLAAWAERVAAEGIVLPEL